MHQIRPTSTRAARAAFHRRMSHPMVAAIGLLRAKLRAGRQPWTDDAQPEGGTAGCLSMVEPRATRLELTRPLQWKTGPGAGHPQAFASAARPNRPACPLKPLLAKEHLARLLVVQVVLGDVV